MGREYFYSLAIVVEGKEIDAWYGTVYIDDMTINNVFETAVEFLEEQIGRPREEMLFRAFNRV